MFHARDGTWLNPVKIPEARYLHILWHGLLIPELSHVTIQLCLGVLDKPWIGKAFKACRSHVLAHLQPCL